MLTRAGVTAIAISVAVLATGRILGLPELFVVGAAGLAVVALAILYVTLRRLRVEVGRTVTPRRVHSGNPCRVDLVLRNRSRLRSPVVRLHDAVTGTRGVELLIPPMRAGAGSQAVYRVPTERRGVVRIGPLRLTVTDPFGLARLTTTGDREMALVVYPTVEELRPLRRSSGGDIERRQLLAHQVAPAGDEFYALREYVVGDDLRRVHWPSSARHDDLLVRQDELPWYGRLTILLDTRPGPPPATFERMVSAAASIAAASIGRDDQVRLLTTDGTDTGFAKGGFHLDRVLDVLALVEQRTQLSTTALDRLTAVDAGGAIVHVTSADTSAGPGLLDASTAAYRYRVLVRFVESGATPPGAVPPLRSTTVITVGPTDSFAHAWIRTVGPDARVAR